jgi:hypothetical protein
VAGVLFEVVARLAKRAGSAAQASMTAERQGPLHHADGALRFLLRSARGPNRSSAASKVTDTSRSSNVP